MVPPNPLLGVTFHSAGAFLAANCYAPQKYVRRWSWEIFWMTQAAWCWLLWPIIGAICTIPNLMQVLADAPKWPMLLCCLVTPVDVISILERAMYCTSQYGVPAYLHMPIQVFNRLKQEHLIEFDGLRWRTPMGSVVSAGCYAGLTPAGAAPAEGTFWIYATGQTVVWRTGNGEEEVIPVQGALNRTTNQYTALVEREYAVTFECAVYAKPVTLWAP